MDNVMRMVLSVGVYDPAIEVAVEDMAISNGLMNDRRRDETTESGEEYIGQEMTCYLVHHLLEEFASSKQKKLILQKNLSTEQKNYLLSVMQCMGFKHRYTENESAYLYKKGPVMPFVRMLIASMGTIERISHIRSLVKTNDKCDDTFDHHPLAARTISSLTLGKPYVPKPPLSNAFRKHRELLPVFGYRAQILNLINKNAFCIIKGSAGCGKSTQIPQYILEDAEARKLSVRILACLPDSIAVLSVSDRVAMERGERMGYTVGYQITLESSSSPVDSLLNFVTAPVLLRGMTIPGCQLLATTTHIIMDEIHCRLQGQDFLLACLRDAAVANPHLKIIFMGEEVNMSFITDYIQDLGECQELLIERNDATVVRTFYLEDIIRFSWESNDGIQVMHQMNFSSDDARQCSNAKESNVDGLIEKLFRRIEIEESFSDFFFLYRSGDVNIDYAHSKSSITMLMASCATGRLDFVQALLKHGASLQLRSKNGYSAMDWAKYFKSEEIETFLNYYRGGTVDSRAYLLEDYMRHSDPFKVDLNLVVRLLNFIHVTDMTRGGIIVFLPDYEDLCELQSLISSKYKNDLSWGNEPLVIHLLHPYIQSGDQRAIYAEPKLGFRKIILSTNIGEHSFTFNDMMFVIDTGKINCVANDPIVASTQPWNHRGSWISKTDASQRKERAGRAGPGGVCYRLYTEECYNAMGDVVVPEMYHSSLTNLCLQARALLRSEVPLSRFFSQLPSPPTPEKVNDAVETLKLTGALDKEELLTELGIHVMDYNIEPEWAKAVLYSVIFKCLDPILTIAACMSYGNQFINQTHPRRRQSFYTHKHKLSSETKSDHMALLKAFHKWESERAMRKSQDLEAFCEDSCISPWNFEIVYEIRSRLLGQLRASGFVHNKGLFDVKSLNKYSDNYSLVRAVLVASLYPNICVADRVTQTWFDRNNKRINVAKSSVLCQEKNFWEDLRTDWMIFNGKCNDKDESHNANMGWSTLVNPLAIALMAGDLYFKATATEMGKTPIIGGKGFVFSAKDRSQCGSELEKVCLNIDDWIRFFSFNMKIVDVIPFRGLIHDMIIRRLRQPQNYPTKMDERVLQTIVEALTEEDRKLGLKQASVGQWPKLVSGNLLSVPGTGFEVTR